MEFLQAVPHLVPFLDVYGNTYKRIHFLALRFKRRILHYTSNQLDSSPILPPPHSILTVRGKVPPIRQDPPRSFLLFTDPSQKEGIRVPDYSVETLLRKFFPENHILYSHFKCDVLYIVANQNPLQILLKKCRRDPAFKLLHTLWHAQHRPRDLTYREISQLRFFKRYDRLLHHCNRWSALAFALCHHQCLQRTGSSPSAFLGRDLFRILKRSQLAPGPLPPASLYQCEILFTESEPLGVTYLYQVEEKKGYVTYVSPMVVAKPPAVFRDSSSMICNFWIPLYRNATAWNEFGMQRYLENLNDCRMHLQKVMGWLHLQESEKYRFILMDLVQVSKIVSRHGESY